MDTVNNTVLLLILLMLVALIGCSTTLTGTTITSVAYSPTACHERLTQKSKEIGRTLGPMTVDGGYWNALTGFLTPGFICTAEVH